MRTQFTTKLGVCLAAAMALGLSIYPASAAVTNLLTVKLSIETNIGKTVLPAGEYTVRDIQNGGGSTGVLEFTSANGRSVNALVREIPSGGEWAAQTGVILRPEAGHYQIDKIWIEGRDHGYQLVTAEIR